MLSIRQVFFRFSRFSHAIPLSFSLTFLAFPTLTLWLGPVEGLTTPGRAKDGPPALKIEEAIRLASQGTVGLDALRKFAASQPAGEAEWLASLVVGYREYQEENFRAATRALRDAVGRPFIVADYASYFFAQSAARDERKEEAVAVLKGYADKYPYSPYRVRAVADRAEWLIDLGKSREAIARLQAEPQLEEEPAWLLVLAKAHLAEGRSLEAVQTFHRVYYSHPTSRQAGEAQAQLGQLRMRWGRGFPQAAAELQTQRANILFQKRRYLAASEGYRRLLAAFPRHPSRDLWKLRRIRASRPRTSRTGRVAALRSLSTKDPEVDAERWQRLVAAYKSMDRVSEMHEGLEILARNHSVRPAYEAALMDVGNYYLLQADRRRAADYYRQLVTRFPQGSHASRAHWRLAWSMHLHGEKDEAQRLFSEHIRNYPGSSQFTPALYWLGRYEQAKKNFGAARAYLQRLAENFPFGYYAIKARARLIEGWGKVDSGSDHFPLPFALPATGKGQSSEEPHFGDEAFRSLARAELLLRLSLDELEGVELTHAQEKWPDSREINFALAKRNYRRGRYGGGIYYAIQAYPGYRYGELDQLPREAWSVLFPRPFLEQIMASSIRHEVDSTLVLALIRQESGFHARARSVSNAHGLMQLIPGTGRRMARQSGKRFRTRLLYRPDYNLDLGCRYLKFLLERFDNQVELALAAYNSGEHRVDKWLRQREYREPAEFVASIPFSQTRNYVRVVMSNLEIYRRLTRNGGSRREEESQPRP